MIFPESDKHFIGRDPAKYQRQIYDLALNYVTGRGTAVDIGAHVGIFTRRMEEDFQTVHSFEPEPDNFRCLSQNCKTATLHNVALFECYTVGKMINPRHDNSGAWEFMPVGNVQGVPLDSFELENVDLIKIDVQGSEEPVLIGAKETLARCRPVLIVENPHKEQLKELGYKMVKCVNKDGVFVYDV
jgi:FkbM family methyltransferase